MSTHFTRRIMISVEIEGTKDALDALENQIRNADRLQSLIEAEVKRCTGKDASVSLAPELDPEDEITPNPNGECA